MATEITIDKALWHRGKTYAESYLIDDYGCSCIFGFVANQCGVPGDVLYRVRTLAGMARNGFEIPEELTWAVTIDKDGYFKDSPEAWHVYGFNDDPSISDMTRIEELVERLRPHRLALTFV